MYLREVVDIDKNIKLIKDSEFSTLALMKEKLSQKTLTFIEKEEYIEHLSEAVSCVIVNSNIAKKVPNQYGVLVSDRPRITFFLIHNYLSDNNSDYYRTNNSTSIGANCKISRTSVIYDNVLIGNNVTIEDFVIIYPNTVIGDNSIIRSGSIVGGVGFEFKINGKEEIIPVTHSGGVLISNNVEIQHNSCVDRAIYPWDNTVLNEHVKIDNLVHIAHGAKIGKRTLIAASAMIAGRTIIGDDCWVGPGVSVSNGLVIGDNARLTIGSVVTKDVHTDQVVTGNFAIEHSKFMNFIKKIR